MYYLTWYLTSSWNFATGLDLHYRKSHLSLGILRATSFRKPRLRPCGRLSHPHSFTPQYIHTPFSLGYACLHIQVSRLLCRRDSGININQAFLRPSSGPFSDQAVVYISSAVRSSVAWGRQLWVTAQTALFDCIVVWLRFWQSSPWIHHRWIQRAHHGVVYQLISSDIGFTSPLINVRSKLTNS